ncbi:MAG: acyltransferase domain-containing protein, partial [Fimbriiglobus sp.]
RDTTDLPKLLGHVARKLAVEPTAKSWNTPDGAYYGTGPAGKLAVLFPGQGSQAVGMLRELVCTFPEALDTLARANRAVAAENPDESDLHRLSDRIYPPPAFTPEAKTQHDATLRATDVAQPAIGAVSFAALRVLRERFGLDPAAFAGHSYGELVALAAADRLSPDELFHLSRVRGRLMSAPAAGGDAGAMLAVLAPLPDIEAGIAAHTLNVVIANKNAPRQAVLSGSTKEIARAEQAFSATGVRCAKLPVAAAFHSPLVADAAAPFRFALDSVALPPGTRPVFSNTTAAEYPSDSRAARDLLGHQLANPVAFADEVRAMHAAGVRTFVEVGPGSVLTRLAEATLTDAGADAQAFALDASGGKKPGLLDLAATLARLAAAGHPVTLAAWEAGSRCRPAPPPPAHAVPICGANHVTPRPARPPAPPRATVPERPTFRPETVGFSAMPDPVPGPVADPAALDLTHQTLTALQRLQEQTAQLHKQFLDSQQLAQQTLFALVNQQQNLLFPGSVPVAPVPPAVPVARSQEWRADVAAPPPSPPPPAKTAPIPTSATSRVAPPVAVATPAVPPPPVPVPVVALNGKSHHAPAPAATAVMQTLLDVVAEKTGYPVEMLEPAMALDADLGVDSIKRVEILSALQDRLPAAPQVKPEHLGALHTLQDVANFLAAGASTDADFVIDIAATPTTAGPGSSIFPRTATHASTDLAAAAADVLRILLDVVAEKTGYPVGMLEPGMALDADLGVDSIKRVEI